MVEFKLLGIRARPKLTEGHPMFIENCTRELELNDVYPRKYIKILSVCILIIGFLILILQIAISIVHTFANVHLITLFLTLIGPGIWAGLFSVTAGIMGLVAAHKRSISITLYFSIIATIDNFMATLLIICNSLNVDIYPRNNLTIRVLQAGLIFLGIFLFMVSGTASHLTCSLIEFRSKILQTTTIVAQNNHSNYNIDSSTFDSYYSIDENKSKNST